MLNLSLPGFGPEIVPIIAATEGAGALAAAGSAASVAIPAATAAAEFGSAFALANSVPSFLSGLSAADIFSGIQGVSSLTGLAGSAFQGSMKMPGASPLPVQKSPAEMPDPESVAVKIKSQRDAALRSQKFGRQSTFLTDSDETRLG